MDQQVNPWDFWQRRLGGEDVPLHDGDPQQGFYRLSRKDGTSEAIAIWFTGTQNALRARKGADMWNPQEATDYWTYYGRHAVSKADYDHKLAEGRWPNENGVVQQQEAAEKDKPAQEDLRLGIGGNNPPADAYTAIKQDIENLVIEANRMIKAGGAKTKDVADQASDVAGRLADLWKKADAERAKEKKPHDDASKAVQAKWLPLLGEADIYRKLKNTVCTPYQVALDKAEKEKAAAAAKAGTPIQNTKENQRSKTTVGSAGRRSTTLKTRKIVTISDRAALLEHFKDSEAITAVLQDLAQRSVNGGFNPPGVTVTEEPYSA